MYITTLRLLTVMSGLTLAIGVEAFAEPQLEQPTTIASSATPDVEEDLQVTPAGCTDSCCGGKTASVREVCCPKRVTEEVKKHCWKVKNEKICIPGFRFRCNWKKCGKKECGKQGCACDDTCCSSDSCSDSCSDCLPTCGRVRCIKVLEKHEYTCDKCGYEWEVRSVGSGNRGCCGGQEGCCCPSCGCASVEAEKASDVELTSVVETTTEAETETPEPSLAGRLIPWLK